MARTAETENSSKATIVKNHAITATSSLTTSLLKNLDLDNFSKPEIPDNLQIAAITAQDTNVVDETSGIPVPFASTAMAKKSVTGEISSATTWRDVVIDSCATPHENRDENKRLQIDFENIDGSRGKRVVRV